MWVDRPDGNVCNVFDFGSMTVNKADNKIVYTDGDKIITLNLDPTWQSSGWEYNEDDSYFYYTGELSSKMTPVLLTRVEVNDAAYALAADYGLMIDVLADAIQSSGDAKVDRGWVTPTAAAGS